MEVSPVALRSFLLLAEELHFARAAQRLHVSAPSLSQQIARLEARIGQQLFDRTPQQVSLTSAGRALLPFAVDVVRALDAVSDWATGSAESIRPLRLGIVASGAGPLTGTILSEFLRRRPGQRLELVHLGFFDAAPAVADDRVDVAIALSPVPLVDGLTSTILSREPRVLVVREDHPLAHRRNLRIDETNNLDFVVPRAAEGASLAWWLVDPRPDGSHPSVTARADGVEGLMELCAAGLGVNIATRSAASQFGRPGLVHIDIDDIEPVRIELIRASRPRHPLVELFTAVALSVRETKPGHRV